MLYPDPQAGQGQQVFHTTLTAGADIGAAVEGGHRLNVPPTVLRGVERTDAGPLIQVTGDGVVVESVKLAEDRSGDVVLRLYEAHGSRARIQVSSLELEPKAVSDLLEGPPPNWTAARMTSP